MCLLSPHCTCRTCVTVSVASKHDDRTIKAAGDNERDEASSPMVSTQYSANCWPTLWTSAVTYCVYMTSRLLLLPGVHWTHLGTQSLVNIATPGCNQQSSSDYLDCYMLNNSALITSHCVMIKGVGLEDCGTRDWGSVNQ